MATMRKNQMTFGRIKALKVWGPDPVKRTFLMDLDPRSAATLAALLQAAVVDHYSHDRRTRAAKRAPVQLIVEHGDRPGLVVKRARKVVQDHGPDAD